MTPRVLKVDFNEQNDDGFVEVKFDPLGRYSLVDGDGNYAVGKMVAIENGVARIQVDWTTWRPWADDEDAEPSR